MKQIAFLIPAVIALSSCKPPLAPILGQQVVRISVFPLSHKHLNGHTAAIITNKEEIDFVTKNLASLKAKRFDHSSPEFDLQFETATGSTLKLRVSRIEVGPDAPASANNTHWFPNDKATFRKFYDFLIQKTLTTQ
jgi:hypothetical protein